MSPLSQVQPSEWWEIVGIKGRAKILNLLWTHHALTISEIERQSGLSSKWVRKHLGCLEAENLVVEETHGRVRLFRLNSDDKRVRALFEFVAVWDEYNRTTRLGFVTPS